MAEEPSGHRPSIAVMRTEEPSGAVRAPARWFERTVTAIGALAVLFVVTRYHHTYFFYDEWGMIDRVTSGSNHLDLAFRSFNGHLWVFPYLTYLAQVRWFGLATNWPVFTLFCVSLVALYLAIVAVLHALRVPLPIAAAAAAVVTYFGPGSQDMVFEVQLSWNFAAAFGLLAAVIVLRARPSWVPASAAAVSLVIAAGWDSVGATLLLVLVAIVAVRMWRRAIVLVTLAPAATLVGTWWLLIGHSAPNQGPSSAGAAARFAVRLVLSAFGGLVAHGIAVGAFAAMATVTILAIAMRRERVGEPALTALIAGAATTAASVGMITVTRAGLVGKDLRDYNRYIQLIAILLVVTLLPALVDFGRSGRLVPDRRRTILAVVAILVVFVANLSTMRSYRDTFELWNAQTRNLVAQSVGVVAAGCPPGSAPDPAALPLGSLDPQISVSLLQRLRSQHVALPTARTADRAVVTAICTNRA
jgi:hypothetical protein